MTDPNIAYKEGWQRLKSELGRNPTIHDAGWLSLCEEYKRGWCPAEETVLPPNASAAGPPIMVSRQQAPQARAIGTEAHAREGSGVAVLPLSGPSVIQNGRGAESSPERVIGAPEPLRGPMGGLMAECVGCGKSWERPVRTGRPSYKCGECR